jgi:uncharacterized protein YukE
MAKIQSSPEVVRQMKSDLNKTAKELNNLSGRIRAVRDNTRGEWNDAQGEQFRELLTRISRLIGSPEEALKSAQPKLEKLAQSLDSYGKVKF